MRLGEFNRSGTTGILGTRIDSETNPYDVAINTVAAVPAHNMSARHVKEFLEVLQRDFFLTLSVYKFIDIHSPSCNITEKPLVDLISIAEAKATMFSVLQSKDIDDITKLYELISGVVVSCNDPKLKQEVKSAIQELSFYKLARKPKGTKVETLPGGVSNGQQFPVGETPIGYTDNSEKFGDRDSSFDSSYCDKISSFL
jgi:hypothetical protein